MVEYCSREVVPRLREVVPWRGTFIFRDYSICVDTKNAGVSPVVVVTRRRHSSARSFAFDRTRVRATAHAQPHTQSSTTRDSPRHPTRPDPRGVFDRPTTTTTRMVTDPARAERAAVEHEMHVKGVTAKDDGVTNDVDVVDVAVKRVERLPKPDRDGFAAKIATLTEITDAKQKRIEEIKAVVNTKRDQRKQSANENQPMRDRLAELTTLANTKIAERNALRSELATNDERRNAIRDAANAMRAVSKFLTDESIDAEIARIDHKISHETMSLTEEKKLVDQIKKLNKNRDFVKEYAEKQAQINDFELARKTFSEGIRAKDAEINAVKADQAKIRSILDASKSKDDAANADVPKLIEEKNAAYEVIKATREEIRVLREAHKKEEDKYWAREKQFRAYQKAEKQKQWEAGQEERKAREEERKRWELENAPEPFEEEVAACDTLLVYLSKFDSRVAAPTKKEEESAATTESVTKAMDGMMLLKRDEDEDDDMFAVSSRYNKKSKKQNGKKNQSNDDERIQLSLDTLGYFAKISVGAVSKTSEVPSAVDAIKAKKEEFLERRKVKKERIAAGLPDEEEEEAKAKKGSAAKEKKAAATKEKKKGASKKNKAKAGVSLTLTVEDERVIVALIVEQ